MGAEPLSFSAETCQELIPLTAVHSAKQGSDSQFLSHARSFEHKQSSFDVFGQSNFLSVSGSHSLNWTKGEGAASALPGGAA